MSSPGITPKPQGRFWLQISRDLHETQLHFHEGEGVFHVPLEILYRVQQLFSSFQPDLVKLHFVADLMDFKYPASATSHLIQHDDM